MPTARVIKTSGYTTMSNYHLQKDKSLSLKAKGLLSVMLSLPDETWHFSIRGLASLCGDQRDSVGTGLKELEQAGYLVREQTHQANGQLGEMIYYIYELPREMMQQREDILPQQDDCITQSRTDEEEDGESRKSKNVEIASFQPCPDFPATVNPATVNPAPAPNKELSEVNNNILNTKQGDGGKERAREDASAPVADQLEDPLVRQLEQEDGKNPLVGEQPETGIDDKVWDTIWAEIWEDLQESLEQKLEENPERSELKAALTKQIGSYREPAPLSSIERRERYQRIGLNDSSFHYFRNLCACALEDLLYAVCRRENIHIGPEELSHVRLGQLLVEAGHKRRGYIRLIVDTANRIIAASDKSEIQSPRRYARSVMVDVLQAGETQFEAEQALVEKPYLKLNVK